MKSMKLSDVQLLQAERHMKLPSPETQLRHKRQVYIGVLQADPLCQLCLDLRPDPLVKYGIHVNTGSTDEKLTAEELPRERPGTILGGVEIGLETAAKLDPKVVIGRLEKGSALLDPSQHCCSRFLYPSGLLLLYLLLQVSDTLPG